MTAPTKRFTLIDDQQEAYARILEVVPHFCTQLQLIVQEHFRSSSIDSALRSISAWQIAAIVTSEWPGTQLLGGEATAYRYALNVDTLNFLERHAANFGDWIGPELPEVISFLRADGSCFLGSSSHENDVFLEVTEEEYGAIGNRGADFWSFFGQDA